MQIQEPKVEFINISFINTSSATSYCLVENELEKQGGVENCANSSASDDCTDPESYW